MYASRAPCDPQLPTRIRPQAFIFARLPRTLRPPIPTRIRPQVLIFARFPRTLRPQLPTRIRPQAFNFASPPCTLRIRPQALDLAPFPCAIRPPDPDWNPASNARFCTLPMHPANPSSRLESGLKRSILHASHAPSDPPIPTRIRPQVLILTRFPRTLRPPAPDYNPASSAHFWTPPAHPPTPDPD